MKQWSPVKRFFHNFEKLNVTELYHALGFEGSGMYD